MTRDVVMRPVTIEVAEAWRRLAQELQGSRYAAYDASRRRARITQEQLWLLALPGRELAVLFIESEEGSNVLLYLATSQAPFDRWWREQVELLLGVDMLSRLLLTNVDADLLSSWPRTNCFLCEA